MRGASINGFTEGGRPGSAGATYSPFLTRTTSPPPHRLRSLFRGAR